MGNPEPLTPRENQWLDRVASYLNTPRPKVIVNDSVPDIAFSGGTIHLGRRFLVDNKDSPRRLKKLTHESLHYLYPHNPAMRRVGYFSNPRKDRLSERVRDDILNGGVRFDPRKFGLVGNHNLGNPNLFGRKRSLPEWKFYIRKRLRGDEADTTYEFIRDELNYAKKIGEISDDQFDELLDFVSNHGERRYKYREMLLKDLEDLNMVVAEDYEIDDMARKIKRAYRNERIGIDEYETYIERLEELKKVRDYENNLNQLRMKRKRGLANPYWVKWMDEEEAARQNPFKLIHQDEIPDVPGQYVFVDDETLERMQLESDEGGLQFENPGLRIAGVLYAVLALIAVKVVSR